MDNNQEAYNQGSQKSNLFSSVLSDMVKIFSALSSDDSLRIFYTAQNGIESSTRVIKELGLTQKKYYTRLNELLKAGLLHKNGDAYQYTALGKICYELGQLFAETLCHSTQLELIDRVESSSTLSLTEKKKVIESISKEGLVNFSDLLSGAIRPVGIVTKFEDLKTLLSRLIERTEKSMRLATRYTDVDVSETIIKCVNRGVDMYFLDGDKQNLSTKLQLLRLVLSNPLKMRAFYQILNSPRVHVRYCDLPFSFFVSDEKYSLFELINPDNNEFIAALYLENEALAMRFAELFSTLYTNAKEDPLKAFAKDDVSKKPMKITSTL